MSANGFIWFYGGDEGWLPFSDEHQDVIERARLQREDHAIIHINQSAYIINFTDFIQENLANGNRRPISQARENTVWYWRGDHGEWNIYGREQAAILTRAEEAGEYEAYFEIGHTLYRVDLARRVQIHFENGSSREIRLGRAPTPRPTTHAAADTEEPDLVPDPPNIPAEFLCPISMRMMRDPVTTTAGSTYERSAIEQWLRKHDSDPMTNRKIENLLIPNPAVKDAITDFLQNSKPSPSDTRSSPVINSDWKKHRQVSVVSTTNTSFSTFNDTLKVIFLGNDKMGTTSVVQRLVHGVNPPAQVPHDDASPPSIQIQEWRPVNWSHESTTETHTTVPIRFNVWDFRGRDVFHAHRSIFFAPQSLYVIVWDMGVSNPGTKPTRDSDPRANQALRRDILEKVQFWVDLVQAKVPGAVILVVASFCDFFSNVQKSGHGTGVGEDEAKRRCKVLRQQLVAGQSTIIFGPDDDPVIRVSGATSVGLDVLREKMISIGKNTEFFNQIGTPLHQEFLNLRNLVRSMKNDGHKIIDLDGVRSQLVGVGADLVPAVSWLSNVGEALSIGDGDHRMLVLDMPWFSKLSGCMLVQDWKATVSATRRRLGKGEMYRFAGALNDNYPMISLEDCRMLWHSFFNDSHARNDQSFVASLLDVLPDLLVNFGILVPIERDIGPLSRERLCSAATINTAQYLPPMANPVPDNPLLPANLVFVPSLLETGDLGGGLRTPHMATGSSVVIAQVVDLFDGAPTDLMERILAILLHNIDALVKSKKEVQGVRISSVRTMSCWRSIFNIKFVASDDDGQETVVVVCSQLLEADEGGTVLSRLITSGNEIQGSSGRDMWQAGYGLVLETIRSVVEGYTDLQHLWRTLCPQCVATRGIFTDSSWSNDDLPGVLTAENVVECRKRGHRVCGRLLTGTGKFENTASHSELESKVKYSVVLIGLYDASQPTNKVRKLGSGFIVDSEKGLIVTAARTLLRIAGQERFGQNYFGIVGAKIVIGVASADTGDTAVFRYFARIYSKDPSISAPNTPFCRVDACVLKITSRFENDIVGNGDGCHEEIEILLRDNALMRSQNLSQLYLTPTSRLEEQVRIFGYEQDEDSSVNLELNSSPGDICQYWTEPGAGEEAFQYQPKNITVVMSRAKAGHTGGPCVNKEGEVVGILSCADPNEKDTRSFVVPVSEWQHWLQ